MNYPEELRERWNECMYDERDIIEKFLKDQYDLRYGRQRDSWHFEPAVNMLSHYGNVEHVTDIMLDKDRFVIFILNDHREYECTDFAYGELSKVIEVLPNADEIVRKNAIHDITIDLKLNGNLVFATGEKHIIGDGFDVIMVTMKNSDATVLLSKCNVDSEPIPLENLSTMELQQLRDHINIEVLHCSDEYKKLVKFLSEQPNLRFEPSDWGHVMFTIQSTDVEVDVLSASLDSNGKLQLCVDDDNKEAIYLEEKDIRPEYLVDLVGYIEDHCRCDIMDTYNAHNPELVRKINAAWRDDKYHNSFSEILLALLYRDHEEYIEKYGEVEDYSVDYAMAHAHEIMEGVCDDLDLECILNFIRYEED